MTRSRLLPTSTLRILLALGSLACADRPSEVEVKVKTPVDSLPARAPSVEIHTNLDTMYFGGPGGHAVAVVRDSTGKVDSSDTSARWSMTDPRMSASLLSGDFSINGNVDAFFDDTIVVTVRGMTARHPLVGAPTFDRLAFINNPTLRGLGTADSLHIFTIPATPLPRAAFSWSSSNPAVMSVSADGIMTAKALGVATLRVSYFALSDVVTVRVGTSYHVVEIPQSFGTPYRVRLNERGDVIAVLDQTDPSRVLFVNFLWQNGQPQTLDACNVMFDLDDVGDVLCSAKIDGSTRLAQWSNDALHPVVGFPDLSADCLDAKFNGSGAIAYVLPPYSGCPAPTEPRAALWTPSGATPLPPPVPAAEIVRLDNAGNITVSASGGGWWRNAATGDWVGFSMTPPGGGAYYVTAVNGRGLLAGMAQPAFDRAPPVGFWALPGQAPQGMPYGPINGVNDANQVAGYWNDFGTGLFGLLDGPSFARLQDLTADTNWRFGDAKGINNKGVIVAAATNRADGHRALVLLVPDTP